jgi:hypothetical protein
MQASLADNRRSPQGDTVISIELDQQHSQCAGALRASLPDPMKKIGRLRGLHASRRSWQTLSGPAICARRECDEQLARILEIAAPQHPYSLTCQPIGLIGADLVVGYKHRLRWRQVAL